MGKRDWEDDKTYKDRRRRHTIKILKMMIDHQIDFEELDKIFQIEFKRLKRK